MKITFQDGAEFSFNENISAWTVRIDKAGDFEEIHLSKKVELK